MKSLHDVLDDIDKGLILAHHKSQVQILLIRDLWAFIQDAPAPDEYARRFAELRRRVEDMK